MFQAYLITCRMNGKQYVGITARGIERRWDEHLSDARNRPRSALGRAISKYGRGLFSIEDVCGARTWADLCLIEAVLIRQFGTRTPCGYNLTDGGEGAFGAIRSRETRELMAAAKRGIPRSAETRAAVSAGKRGIRCNVGASNGGAKLTAGDVREIRALLAAGATQRSAGRQFGVSFTAIWKIANGLKWRVARRASSPAP